MGRVGNATIAAKASLRASLDHPPIFPRPAPEKPEAGSMPASGFIMQGKSPALRRGSSGIRLRASGGSRPGRSRRPFRPATGPR